MTHDDIARLFTRSDGSYLFARWGRPIAPIVFGVEDATLEVVKGALEAVVTLAGHQMAETDPELGSNLMFFFFRDWDELLEVPDLDRLVPDLAPLVARLKGAGQISTGCSASTRTAPFARALSFCGWTRRCRTCRPKRWR